MKSEKRSWCSSALRRLLGGSSGCDRTENTAQGPSPSSPLPSHSLNQSGNYWTLLPHYLFLAFVTPLHCILLFLVLLTYFICLHLCLLLYTFPFSLSSSPVASLATSKWIKCICHILLLMDEFDFLFGFVCVCAILGVFCSTSQPKTPPSLEFVLCLECDCDVAEY